MWILFLYALLKFESQKYFSPCDSFMTFARLSYDYSHTGI